MPNREVTAFLKLDDAEWNLVIDRAEARSDELSRKSPNVKVRVDAADALAKLELVYAATLKVGAAEAKVREVRESGTTSTSKLTSAEAALAKARADLTKAVNDYERGERKLGNAVDDTTNKTFKATRGLSGLRGALIEVAAVLGPSLIPMLAVTTAYAGALGLGLVAAGVAVLGIIDNMKAGAYAGTQFGNVVASVAEEWENLQHVAAQNAVAGFTGTIRNLNAQFDPLNRLTGTLAFQWGEIGGHLGNALISVITRMAPLFESLDFKLVGFTAGLDHWAATSPAIQNFMDYVNRSLPPVTNFVTQLGTALGHSALALGTFVGPGVLNGLTLVLRLFNAVPIGLLRDIGPAVYGFALALRLLKTEAIATAPVMLALTNSIGKWNVLTLVASGIAALSVVLNGGAQSLNNYSNKTSLLSEIFQNHIVPGTRTTGKEIDALGNIFTQITGKVNPTNQQLLEFYTNLNNSKAVGDNFADSFIPQIRNTTQAVLSLGVSQHSLELGVLGTDASFQKFIGTLARRGASQQLITDLTKIHDTLGGVDTSTINLTTDQQTLIEKLGLTTDQAKQYAAMLGVTEITAANFGSAVKTVATAENTATRTGSGFLAALQQFATSAGSAADRAALIGATLKAGNGDLLAYTGSLAGVTEAHRQLTSTFQDETKQTVLGIKTFRDTEKAAIDLKTGLIDFSKQGAQPLVQQLTAIQSAAMDAASATYQHELATKGATKAADDAYTRYQQATRGQLIDEAAKLGLTKDQAKKLADQYFGMPKDVKTKIEQEGANPIVEVLNKIGQQLAFLTGHPWVTKHKADTRPAVDSLHSLQETMDGVHQRNPPRISIHDSATAQVNKVQRAIAELKGKMITISEYERDVILPTVRTFSGSHDSRIVGATGGLLQGPGGPTSDSIPAWLSNGEFVVNAAATKAALPLLQAINAQKYAAGGQVGNTEVAITMLRLLSLMPTSGSAPADLQRYAQSLFPRFGWSPNQISALISLWSGESGWRWNATNPSSGAYGIPQALPPGKMASAGADWRTNPATQIAWGESYIAAAYGSPAAAWSAWLSRSPHWYGSGGTVANGWGIVGESGPELIHKSGADVRVYSRPSESYGQIQVIINVAGTVTAERALISTVHQGIREALRRNGKSVTAQSL